MTRTSNTHYIILFIILTVAFGAAMVSVISDAASNDNPPAWRTTCIERDTGKVFMNLAIGIPPVGNSTCLRYDYVCQAGPAYKGKVVCTTPKPQHPPS